MVYALRASDGRLYPVGAMLRIGSDPSNQIVLQDPQVSRFHVTLAESQGKLLLRDENSTNGTFVNQTRIQDLVEMQPGSSFSVGNSTFTTEQVPEQVFVSPPARLPAKKRGCGCSLWPLAMIIVFSMTCLGLFGSAYYLYKAPKATQQKVLALVGQGPGSIQIENLSDVTVFVFATSQLDRTSTDGTIPNFLWELGSFGTNSKDDQNAGAYRIDFGTQSGEMDLGTCIFQLKSGQVFHFVVLPDDILIDRTEYPPILDREPASIDDLVVADSSLCKYTPE
jgi:hypothetical protein